MNVNLKLKKMENNVKKWNKKRKNHSDLEHLITMDVKNVIMMKIKKNAYIMIVIIALFSIAE